MRDYKTPYRATTANKFIKFSPWWGIVMLGSLLILLSFPKSSPKTTLSSTTLTYSLPLPSQPMPEREEHSSILEDAPKQIQLVIKADDNLANLFKRAGVAYLTLHTLLKEISDSKLLTQLRPKQRVTFILDKKQQLQKLLYEMDPITTLRVERTAQGQFTSKVIKQKLNHETRYVTGSVDQALFSSGLKQQIPYQLLQQLVSIFSKKIDFSKDVRKGDHFAIAYKADFLNGKPMSVGHIVAASYTNRQHTYFAFRYPQTGKETDYYTLQGKSLSLGFDRFPLQYTHVSSSFNLNRFHPILHVTRPHRGIDLAAPLGTPIRAVADGKVVYIGRQAGYGNVIKIEHGSKYKTVYAHMHRFKAKLSQGDYVARGQVIGYVGQTGLATAPHCHFEFRIQGEPHNPATVDLPTYPDVRPAKLKNFKQYAEQWVAQLELVDTALRHTHNSTSKA